MDFFNTKKTIPIKCSMTEECFLITGGKRLSGEIHVPCAKNSYLALLSACVLSSGVITLRNAPHFSDIDYMISILLALGCKVERVGKDLIIDSRFIHNYKVDSTLAQKIRSSIFLLGPITARLGKCHIAYPGGCEIGSRPIDLHLKGISKLGVNVTELHGIIKTQAGLLQGCDIHLDYPSVGATENIMMTATLSKGVTRIFNCAKEPEIVDLQNFINCMGGKISGAGTDVIEVEGVRSLHGCDYTPIPDRIIAGTYLFAVAGCGGDVTLHNVEKEHLLSPLNKLRDTGLDVSCKGDMVRIRSSARPITFGRIETLPYPGFPTDLQPQAMALQTISQGTCVLVENLFETRLKHVPELVKMGANIVTKDRLAIISGVDKLYGAEVFSTDLRAGSALTIAGMMAEGQTKVYGVRHIDRGYEDLDLALSQIGADIKRIKQDKL